nr:hypothetical protein Iba_contig1518CG0010 [Ipomoea batatas]
MVGSVAVATFPLSFDHLLRQFIDQTNSLAEHLLRPNIQQSLDLPHRRRRRHGALRRELRREVKGGGELRRWQRQVQAPRIHPEREYTDIIERESPQNILEVQNLPVFSVKRKEREQPRPNLGSHDLECVGANRHASELPACHLPLKLPQISVDGKYAASQQIAQDGSELFPLGKILKLRCQHVLHICRISSDNVVQNMNVNGAGGRFVEHIRIPIAQITMLHCPARRQIRLTNLTLTKRFQFRNRTNYKKDDSQKEKKDCKSFKSHGYRKRREKESERKKMDWDTLYLRDHCVRAGGPTKRRSSGIFLSITNDTLRRLLPPRVH